jgi:hypothetical protein
LQNHELDPFLLEAGSPVVDNPASSIGAFNFKGLRTGVVVVLSSGDALTWSFFRNANKVESEPVLVLGSVGDRLDQSLG